MDSARAAAGRPHRLRIRIYTERPSPALSGYPLSRTSVVWNGLNHPYRAIDRGIAQQRLASAGQEHLLDRPYVLHVGSNQPRKNRDGVLRILAALNGRRDLRIVFAGEKRPKSCLRWPEIWDLRKGGGCRETKE